MMSRREDEGPASSQSRDGVDEVLGLAAVNAEYNRLPGFTAAYIHTEPPRANATDIRPFLRSQADEDREFTAHLRHTSLDHDPLEPCSSSTQQKTSSNRTPAATLPFTTPDPRMERRPRLSKPRLLLMGQRRCALYTSPASQVNLN